MLYNSVGIMGSERASFILHMPINHVIVFGQQGNALLSDDGKRQKTDTVYAIRLSADGFLFLRKGVNNGG